MACRHVWGPRTASREPTAVVAKTVYWQRDCAWPSATTRWRRVASVACFPRRVVRFWDQFRYRNRQHHPQSHRAWHNPKQSELCETHTAIVAGCYKADRDHIDLAHLNALQPDRVCCFAPLLRRLRFLHSVGCRDTVVQAPGRSCFHGWQGDNQMKACEY